MHIVIAECTASIGKGVALFHRHQRVERDDIYWSVDASLYGNKQDFVDADRKAIYQSAAKGNNPYVDENIVAALCCDSGLTLAQCTEKVRRYQAGRRT